MRSRSALSIVLINALVTREGLTTIVRLGDLPILGVTDVTLEATVYGAILGLRAATLILCGALYSLAVDPDAVLGLMRGISFRSALTASIANRMVPVLLRDSRRLADAQRCRPGQAARRVRADARDDLRRAGPRSRRRRRARGPRLRLGPEPGAFYGASRRSRATTSRSRLAP